MTNREKKPTTENEPLTAESLDAAFRLAAEARDDFRRYREMYPDRPTMLQLAVLIEKPVSAAANDINKQLILYRIQRKQELAVRTIHKWCKDPAIIADTEAQTLRIAREHKAWSNLYKDGDNGAWKTSLVADKITGEKFMPPPVETIRQACKEISQYEKLLTRYEATVRTAKGSGK